MLHVSTVSLPVPEAATPHEPLSQKETVEGPAGAEVPGKHLSLGDLFRAFFKAGLAFGGGLGIMAVLEKDLVVKKKVVTREDFLAMYSLGRLVPAGTTTALAVAYGHRFGGWLGGVIAMTALVLPSTILTILLTVAYGALQGGPAVAVLSATVLPAALAFIVAAAIRFGKGAYRPSADLVIAVVAFVAAFLFDVHPSLLLCGGGAVGLLAFRRR